MLGLGWFYLKGVVGCFCCDDGVDELGCVEEGCYYCVFVGVGEFIDYGGGVYDCEGDVEVEDLVGGEEYVVVVGVCLEVGVYVYYEGGYEDCVVVVEVLGDGGDEGDCYEGVEGIYCVEEVEVGGGWVVKVYWGVIVLV